MDIGGLRMIKFLMILPEWLLVTFVIISMIMTVAVTSAVIYRLVRFGIKIKAGIVEVDATKSEEKKNDPE